jgi:multicomponent Na+:H+ antiporter subunit B
MIRRVEMKDTILKEISKIVIPFIQIFGVYIIFHGHLSPGGGFAGGTVIGTSFILYRIVFGMKEAQKKLSYTKLMRIISISLIIYGVLKGYSFLIGGSHLHLPEPGIGIPGKVFSGKYLLPLNILVGTVVSITMYIFYALFSEGEV